MTVPRPRITEEMKDDANTVQRRYQAEVLMRMFVRGMNHMRGTVLAYIRYREAVLDWRTVPLEPQPGEPRKRDETPGQRAATMHAGDERRPTSQS